MVRPSFEVAETLTLPEHMTNTAVVRSPSRKRIEPAGYSMLIELASRKTRDSGPRLQKGCFPAWGQFRHLDIWMILWEFNFIFPKGNSRAKPHFL
jgi:hypothetical protein